MCSTRRAKFLQKCSEEGPSLADTPPPSAVILHPIATISPQETGGLAHILLFYAINMPKTQTLPLLSYWIAIDLL